MSDTWTCFHCDEGFTTEESARIHFGDCETDEPICKIAPSMARRYRDMEKEVARLRLDLEENLSSSRQFNAHLEILLHTYRPFRKCRTIRDVFNIYDSMEGRALAAEERIGVTE